METWQIITAIGVPSAVCAFLFWLIERKISKADRERETKIEEERAKNARREKRNEEFLLLLLETTQAAVVLSEATARAVQRIPDARCNGDMHKALEVAELLQDKQKDFLSQLGIHSLYR